MSPAAVAILSTAIVVGAVIQGATGFGMGLVAAPVIAMVDPALLPATLVMVSVPLPLMTGLREFRSVKAPWLVWGLAGRIPGTFIGVAAVGWFTSRALSLAVAIAVLAAVAASLARWKPRISRSSLVVAGLFSGAAGTATSVGSPPMALLLQRRTGPEVRATLGWFFFVGTVFSVLMLAAGGLVSLRQLAWAAWLSVPMTLGFWMSGRVRRHVDGPRFRWCVVGLVTVSAGALLVNVT